MIILTRCVPLQATLKYTYSRYLRILIICRYYFEACGDVQAAQRAFKLGALAFIEKPYDPQEMLGLIGTTLDLEQERIKQEACRRDISERISQLSSREREVMDPVVTGRLNQQIASDLGIAERTVEDHRHNVMNTMEADSVAELVQMGSAVKGLNLTWPTR